MKIFKILLTVVLSVALPLMYLQSTSGSSDSFYETYYNFTQSATTAIKSQFKATSATLMKHIPTMQSLRAAKDPQQSTGDVHNKTVVRSLRECIKPNGLIDDEVQMCVNGTREKTW